MSGIEEVAKSWLIDPLWQKVFKHTVDVFEDYVSYLLVAIGAVCLSVRLLTTLGTGDVVCMILAVEHQNLSVADLGPYVSGGTLGLINYANTDANCINSVFNKFLEYMPYIMLGQTLLLIITEKFTFRIPRIAQRVERFYKNIVEESLFGKDPDVAEDMYNAATSTDAIGRMRQRNEICVVLKRSSFCYHAYIGKNVVEIILVLLYLPLNIHYGSEEFDKDGTCHININPINGVNGNGIINGTGHVHFQCQGKKMTFFMLALWAQIILLGLHMICSIISIFWCLYFRSVTNLLNTIEAEKGDSSSSLGRLKDAPGEDFLFLFDLLAHSCGLESTLRVLTHSDETFYEICKPEFDLSNGLNLEEDKLQVFFGPCAIERWLQGGKKNSSKHKHIGIDNYEVTIYPAESSRHTQTIPSSLTDLEGHTVVMSGDDKSSNILYNTWFYDLNGGKTEYVITISVVIGKSRMKGEKVVTPLLPYGAEKPRSGMVKAAEPEAVEIFWDPPKGDFTKYVLTVDKLSESVTIKAGTGSLLRLASNTSSSKNLINAIEEVNEENGDEAMTPMSATKRELSSKLNDYKVVGLDPGEAYKIKLGTKTGMVDTRQPIEDIIMTKPKAPKGLRVSDVDSSSCKIHWLHHEKHHSCLKSYQIKIRSSDNKFNHDVTPLRHVKTWSIRHGMLQQAQDYDITVTTLCVRDQITTESEASKISFTTLPESIKNLKLETSTPNSLTVKWDIPIVTNGIKYVLSINANTSEDDEADDDDKEKEITKIKDFEVKNIEVSADKSQYVFNDLPKIIGTGHAYDISVVTVYLSPREVESKSKECKERFMTRPLPPTKLGVGDKEKPLEISWHKSVTPNVVKYKIRWKPILEDAKDVKTDEETIEVVDPDQDQICFSFPPGRVQVAQVYKVNVYAVAESANLSSESKELHEKFLIQNESEIVVYVENEQKIE